MEVIDKDKKIRALCENRAVAQRRLGPLTAHKLKIRLVALEAATCVTDLVAGNPHPLDGDRYGQFAIDLAGGYRLVFTQAHHPSLTGPSGATDWSKVTIIKIEYIGDYHD